MSERIRVAQWASGAVGKTILRGVIDRPDLELVALYVYGDRKAGRDAGDIARRDPTGVIATRALQDVIDARPQVVMHSPRLQVPYQTHDEDLLALLRAGINVITTAGHHFPRAHGPEREQLFLEACRAGSSTLFGVGVSPGIIGERLALGLTGASVEVDSISIDEVLDARKMPDPDFVFTVMGMGSDPEKLDGSGPLPTLYAALYLETIAFVCERMGVRYDEVVPDHHAVPALADIEIAAGRIAAGTVATTEWRWHAMVGGRRFLTLAIVWTMEPDRPEYAGRHHWTCTSTASRRWSPPSTWSNRTCPAAGPPPASTSPPARRSARSGPCSLLLQAFSNHLSSPRSDSTTPPPTPPTAPSIRRRSDDHARPGPAGVR